MHKPYNRRYSNDKALTGESYPGTAAKLVKYGYVVAIVAVHWLDWQLKGNRAAGDWFLGKDCSLCRDKRWTAEQFANP
jgi:hypothetical protein